MNKIILLSTISFLWAFCVNAQNDWKLKIDKEGIKVYTRSLTESKFKALKVETTFNVSQTQLLAAIYDIATTPQWVYSTKSAVLLKQVSPSELYYYSEVILPWPAENRDFIARIRTSQDPKTKVVIVDADNLTGIVPEKNNIVRVNTSIAKWIITPAGKNMVKLDYTLQTDPAGALPAWLVNMFLTKGPYESFKKLREHLKRPEYAKAKYAFIKE